MAHWIVFDEGKYRVEQAALVSPAQNAVMLENATIEIYTGRAGKKQMKGRSLVENILVVDLLNDDDRLDILLDLGGEYKYLLEDPLIQAGKVFAPHIKSSLQFIPSAPWKHLSESHFRNRFSALTFIG